MEYVALLRGINVGGNNKVVMSELREQVAAEGFANVRTYINSGNLLFEAEADVPRDEVAEAIEHVLARRYDFPIRFALLTGQDYLAELRSLPDWWHGEVARRDALFYTRGLDRGHVRERIEAMELGDEAVYFGEHAVFWGKFDEKNFLKTAYHRRLLREDFYRQGAGRPCCLESIPGPVGETGGPTRARSARNRDPRQPEGDLPRTRPGRAGGSGRRRA